jgi:hypothetical protein
VSVLSSRLQAFVGFPQSWIAKTNGGQPGHDKGTYCRGLREIPIGPGALCRLKIAGLLKKPSSIAVCIAWSFIKVANLESTIRLERLGKAPTVTCGRSRSGPAASSDRQVWPSDAEYLNRVHIQMVFVMAVEADSRRKIRPVETHN